MCLTHLVLLGLLGAAPSPAPRAAKAEEKPSWALLQKPPAPLVPAKKAARAAPCQPATITPGETPLEDDESPWNTRGTYALPSGEEVSVNDWKLEEGREVRLPEPYTLTQYTFHCATGKRDRSSDALDIASQGKRVVLYPHVLDFETHPARPILLLDQNEPLKGRFQRFTGLVNLTTLARFALPSLPCVVGAQGRFSGDNLVTYGDRSSKDGLTDVCLWSLEGQLKGWLRARLTWTEGSAAHPREHLGVLPHEPDTFFALDFDPDSSGCALRLQSLTSAPSFHEHSLEALRSLDECMVDESTLGAFRLGKKRVPARR